MPTFRQRQPLTAWITILAVVLASLAPTLSRALGSAADVAWGPVCSADGARWLPNPADPGEPAPAPANLFEHCPYCTLHLSALGLPPAAPDLRPLDRVARADAPPAASVSPGRGTWRVAQPRAPPRRPA